MSSTVIRLVIVTTNDLVRNGIRLLVQHTDAIEVLQSFKTLPTAQQYLENHQAHVLLWDDALPSHLPPHQLVATVGREYPGLRVLVLSDHLSEYYVQRLITHGASGFIYKRDHLEDCMVVGIRTVAQGHIYLSPQASALPYGRRNGDGLNATDLEVLQLISRGFTVQEISSRVGIVDRSVYRIRSKLRTYLDVRTNEQLVEAAQRRGLL